MINIENLELMYFSNCKPVPYKLKCGVEILIHPILVEDWGLFERALEVLKIEKNEINDPKIVTMSYLDFIINIIKSADDEMFKERLGYIIFQSLKEQYMSFEISNGKNVLAIDDENGDIKYYITSKDFDDIKSIILHQNLHDYDDRYFDPVLRKAILAYNKSKNKNSVAPTLELQKVFVISKTGMSMERINKMTYRTFMQVYNFNVKSDIYMSSYIIKASTKYDIKEEVIHPIFEKPRDVLDEIFIDADSFASKIENS